MLIACILCSICIFCYMAEMYYLIHFFIHFQHHFSHFSNSLEGNYTVSELLPWTYTLGGLNSKRHQQGSSIERN